MRSAVVDPLVALLRERREGLGWTQRQLGERMGVGNTTISELECGAASPTRWTLRRWADALDVNLTVLTVLTRPTAESNGRRHA